jgi:hypothetical protein
MLTIEMWSMMLAAYWLPHITRLVGKTTRLDGVVPNEHISVALLTTCIGMAVSPVGHRFQHSAFYGGRIMDASPRRQSSRAGDDQTR